MAGFPATLDIQGGLMALDHLFLIVFGCVLVGLLILAVIYYYLPKRKDKVERAKYRMLEDDDEQ